MLKPTRGTILLEELKSTDGFTRPQETTDKIRYGTVVAVGDFVWHICHEKIYAEAKVEDIVGFVFNGNEKFEENGNIYYSIIFDQCRFIKEKNG